MIGRHSLALRLMVLALGASLVALVAAGLVISGLLRTFVVETFETNLNATMVALMANTQFDEDAGRLRLDASVADPRFEQPFSGWYWQIADADQVLIGSSSLWTDTLGLGLAEPDGSVRRRMMSGPQGERLLVLERDFTAPGGTGRLRVSVAMPEALIEAEVSRIVGPLIWSLSLLGLGLSLAIIVQVRLGLRPLRQVEADLRAIETGQRDTLPAARHDELAPLVAQINSLLAHSRSTIERARTHVGNLAHGLKTPLSGLDALLARSAMPEAERTEVETLSASMNRMISQHLRRARSAGAVGIAGARTPLGAVVDDLLPVFRGIYADRQLAFNVSGDKDAIFAGERDDLEEMLGNLIDNAAKWGRSRIDIAVETPPAGKIAVTVCDDGPGMDDAQFALARERGRRLDESRPGSGLGLAIVSDLTALYGGALRLKRADLGGVAACLELPAAPTGN
ncbi:sensor histidine kinase [Devosia chinhatensis]|uniref:histidine kinase n=1 Tax=Devosia chinhatensis TaxID=429727 RepID=A0A0F5FIM4_9HYPH|nr:HAMP domain-containing sensor histidine kinase [Devosia chinhatensis]KKB08047.1 hypothetical protein VE26_15825 [Devosia chinhatensis]